MEAERYVNDETRDYSKPLFWFLRSTCLSSPSVTEVSGLGKKGPHFHYDTTFTPIIMMLMAQTNTLDEIRFMEMLTGNHDYMLIRNFKSN